MAYLCLSDFSCGYHKIFRLETTEERNDFGKIFKGAGYHGSESRWQGPEAAGDIASTVRKQGVTHPYASIAGFLSCSPEPKPESGAACFSAGLFYLN